MMTSLGEVALYSLRSCSIRSLSICKPFYSNKQCYTIIYVNMQRYSILFEETRWDSGRCPFSLWRARCVASVRVLAAPNPRLRTAESRAIWGSNPLTFQPSKNDLHAQVVFTWRRDGDSNPRYGCPHTHFPGVLLQPLGHLSTEIWISVLYLMRRPLATLQLLGVRGAWRSLVRSRTYCRR